METRNAEFDFKDTCTRKQADPILQSHLSKRPPWAQNGDVSRLTLVAHYDSKYEPEGFIGAIDSAAPCAMLMHVARSIEDALTAKWDKMQKDGSAEDGLEETQGIQIIFLDGEEAFKHWTEEDSLYGARYVKCAINYEPKD